MQNVTYDEMGMNQFTKNSINIISFFITYFSSYRLIAVILTLVLSY